MLLHEPQVPGDKIRSLTTALGLGDGMKGMNTAL